MKIVTNEKLISRNKKIGNYLTIGSILVLGVGLYLSFQPEMIQYSYLALILGFASSQFGISFGNKFGRSPRPDEILNSSLKGLADTFTIYHYSGPVSHLLVGPAGIWILLPYSQKGTILYEKNKWQQKGGNFYLKLFAQEGIGKPDRDAKIAVTDVSNFLKKENITSVEQYLSPALVFTNEKTVVTAPDAPVTTLHVSKLKDFVRKQAKQTNLLAEVTKPLIDVLPKE